MDTFYRYKDQRRPFNEYTLFNFLTVTVTCSSQRNLAINYHTSSRVKLFVHCSVIETGRTMDSFAIQPSNWILDKPFDRSFAVSVSLRSSLFRFLLARGESESQGEVARTHGREPLIFCHLCPPRATPACLKGNGKDCYAGYVSVRFSIVRYSVTSPRIIISFFQWFDFSLLWRGTF